MARFVKGQSGNPSGRPRKRRPNMSAFDIVFDKRLTVTENGVERELTVDEALQLKTYEAALKGSKLAVRQVIKMIEKREAALRQRTPKLDPKPVPSRISYAADSANEAMLLLSILVENADWPDGPRPLLVNTWAAQASFSRPGRRTNSEPRSRNTLDLFVKDFSKVRTSRGGQ